LGTPAREGPKANAVKTFTAQHELLLKGTQRLRLGTGTIDLSIDDSRPVFTVDEVNDSRVWVRVHIGFRRLGVATSRGTANGTDAKKGLELRTEHQTGEHGKAAWKARSSRDNTMDRE
jgi:hypothetical protein